MSENEKNEAQPAELAESELENVAGGGAWIPVSDPPVTITVMPVVGDSTDGTIG